MLETLGTKSRGMERRNNGRAACRTVVRVFPDDGGDREIDTEGALDLEGNLDLDWFCLESTDVSPTGVFLQTDLLFPVGEELDLEFAVPDRGRRVRGRGRVVRVVADGAPSGVAVELRGLSDEERRVLGRMAQRSRR